MSRRPDRQSDGAGDKGESREEKRPSHQPVIGMIRTISSLAGAEMPYNGRGFDRVRSRPPS